MLAMLMAATFVFLQAVRDIIYDADYVHAVTELLGTAGWALMYIRYMNNLNKKKNEQ